MVDSGEESEAGMMSEHNAEQDTLTVERYARKRATSVKCHVTFWSCHKVKKDKKGDSKKAIVYNIEKAKKATKKAENFNTFYVNQHIDTMLIDFYTLY